MNDDTNDPRLAHTLELIRRAKTGEEAALAQLFERYSTRVLEIVRIRLGHSLRAFVESRDILQEALMEAFESFEQFTPRDDASFTGWLARIVEHRIQNQAAYLQAAKRDPRRLVALDPDQPDPDGMVAAQASTERGPEAILIDHERRAALLDAVAELPEPYRLVIAARDFRGARWEEVASETGHSTANAARMTHNRARVALGKLLAERGLI